MQHIVFNAPQEIELIETWKPFWNDLKNVERFMRLKERRDRYVHTCLLNNPFESFTHCFKKMVVHIAYAQMARGRAVLQTSE